MLRVQRGEGCLVIYGLVTFFKAEKRKVNVGDVWFRVSPPSLSLCVSLSVSLSLCRSRSFLFVGVVSLLFICSAVKKFVFYSVFLFWSDQLGFLCFLPRRSRIGRKITFNCFYFLTNFIDISLCADPIHRRSFFHFEESLSTDNIRWMLSWALGAIIILCVR